MKHLYSICPVCGSMGQFDRHCKSPVVVVGGTDTHVVFQGLSALQRIEAAQQLISGTPFRSVMVNFLNNKAKRKLGWK